MFKAIFWSSFAIVSGLVTAFALIVATEGLGAVCHPFPPGLDPNDLEACKAHVAKCPQWFLGVAVGCWGMTALSSVWVATRLGTSRHFAHGGAIGVLLLAAVILNLSMLPYPLWFKVANLVVMPLGIVLGIWLARTPSEPTPQFLKEPV